jgi:ribosome-associated heat shock protein Hsp15
MEEIRIDKWMWATRLFKTRTLATEACNKGRVMIGGVAVKASRLIRAGDVIAVRKPPVTYSFHVIAITANRLNAKLVPQYLENVTPKEEYELLELNRLSGFIDRAKGLGRPTKKERRDLEQFTSPPEEESKEEFDWDEI